MDRVKNGDGRPIRVRASRSRSRSGADASAASREAAARLRCFAQQCAGFPGPHPRCQEKPPVKKYLALASTVVAALAVGVAGAAPAVAVDTPSVTVHVTSAGKPLADTGVLLRPLDGYSDTIAYTDASGTVTYTGLTAGGYT